MTFTTEQFRRAFPVLVHYSPEEPRLDSGLMTASQVLDLCDDGSGHVQARFRCQSEFSRWPVDHWKCNSRFVRGGLEVGSALVVRHPGGHTYTLGNNFPLGNGGCIGTTLPLTDNRPGDDPPSREDWFRLLNDMFWVFDPARVNDGFVERLRLRSPTREVFRLDIRTCTLSDELIESKVRLSAINGGGSNGASARGTATYKPPSEWPGTKLPKEIGLVGGLAASLVGQLGVKVSRA